MQRLIAKPQAIHHARAKILHDNVRFFDQPTNQLDRLLAFQVERQAALSGVELAEIGTLPIAQRGAEPHVVAFRRLDLDNVGADVGEQPSAIRAGQHDREIQHTHALERRRRGVQLLHLMTPDLAARKIERHPSN